MARPIGAKPWSDDELADLARVRPHDAAGVAAFVAKHGRARSAAKSKLATLRAKGAAADVRYRRLDRTITSSARSL